MRVHVNHLSRYEYSAEVQLGIHHLFLLPQYRPYFSLEQENISISPTAEGQNYRQDLFGNWFKQAWFSIPTQSLTIKTEWIFTLHQFNPFAFIIEPNFEQTGWKNPDFQFSYQEKSSFLSPYITMEKRETFSDFLLGMKAKSSGLIDFLVNLTQEIYQNWSHEIRHEQNVWEGEFTFSGRSGSCRDLALMQMQMLNSIGLATRFISGYAFNPDLDEGHELHAWLEVFLPGAGWVGLDPSLGLLTDHRYIPLACHPDPALTLPVQGTFGGKADSILKTFVDLKLLG
ncbi:transglutaminase family protein [Algoriphagus hitonicola]|uniref:Transglutaminase-like enzyme, putative cysteine protease n=1 Tax=Algoriphagus hitonicola TaxID=435880 RepID=A0A1I2T928_9BACT|nr:transglutaminase family protein [Algoriphagus hitonicola]SFG60589.1 Transglutaminase-like enzyme, putative cysteine protease [Algoriphagus hitonicola]